MAKQKIREKAGVWISGDKKGEVVLYRGGSAEAALEVRLEKDTVWLSLSQLADLFDRDKSVVSRHLRNIFKEKELDRKSTVAFFATVQKESRREVTRDVVCFNLDAIISVGYRVNSKRGTQFRIWATNILKEHIVKGYTENTRRLKELRQSLQLVEHVLDRSEVPSDEANALLRVVIDYSWALDLLDDYDHRRVPVAPVHMGEAKPVTYEEAQRIIERFREKFGAPALFLWFMDKNGLLYARNGKKRLADATLVAVALMIAESSPREKDAVVRIAIHLIGKKNQEWPGDGKSRGRWPSRGARKEEAPAL